VETIMQAERFIDKIFYVYYYKIKYPTQMTFVLFCSVIHTQQPTICCCVCMTEQNNTKVIMNHDGIQSYQFQLILHEPNVMVL
jgi:hypothetical protein